MTRSRPTLLRRNHKLSDIPYDLVHKVNELLTAGHSYRAIADYLQAQGHPVSKSSIARYGKRAGPDLRLAKERLEATVQMAKYILDVEGLEALPALASSLALLHVITILIECDTVYTGGALTVADVCRLAAALASLQQSNVQRLKWEAEQADRARKAAQDKARRNQQGGLSDETIEFIRTQILGIPPRNAAATPA